MDNTNNMDNASNTDNKGYLVIYDVPALCKLLDTTPQTVRRYLNEGKIRGRKVGRKWLVDEEAIKEYLRGED